jgi:tetratricopeptide (TPR) repeat protein
MIEVLGPDERRETDRLRRALELRKGPEFHMIVGDTRRVVDAALAEVLPTADVPRETVAPEETPKSFAVRWMKWLEAAILDGGVQPLVLDAWDVDPDHIEHWGWIFGRLNERRNEIMRGLGRPLLLLVSPDNERLLGHMAPDLWSIRGVGMRLRDRGRVAVDRSIHGMARPSGPKPPAPAELARQQERVDRVRSSTPNISHAIEALRLAQALHEAKRDAEALAPADEAIAQYETLAREDDGKLIDLARALRTRAEIAAGTGRRDAALDDLRRSTSIITGLIRQDPERADHLQDLRIGYDALGDLHLAWGQEDRARRFYAQALAIAERLTPLEPERIVVSRSSRHLSAKRGSQRELGAREAAQDLAHGLADVFARISSDSDAARMIALRAGFPPAYLPEFKTAYQFWSVVVEQAYNGRIELEQLVREAVKQFPYNAELREYHERLAAAGKYVPSVFISYSHDSEAHVAQVLALANQLRGDGIDVRLDQYVASPLEGWPTWMKRQVEDVDFVAFVCTANYRHRFEDDTSDTLETLLAKQLFYETSDRKHGLLPVLPAGSTPEDIPMPLRSRTAYAIPRDYDSFYRRITELPKRPPVR